MTSQLDRRTRFVVGSGSLPPGVPDDFYGRLAGRQSGRTESSSSTLQGRHCMPRLEAGVYLVKPSLNEFKLLMGAAARHANRSDQSLPLPYRQRPRRGRRTHARRAGRAPGHARSDSPRTGSRDQADKCCRRRRQLPGSNDLESGLRPPDGNGVSLRRGCRFGRTAHAGNGAMPARRRRTSHR